MQPELVPQDPGPSSSSLRLKLGTGKLIVGRSSKCEFVIHHSSVSRLHAELSALDEAITVLDLESQNGTFVDEQRVLSARVVCGQRLRFGKISFLVKDAQTECQSDLKTDANDNDGLGKPMEKFEFSPAQRRVLQLVLLGHAEKEAARRLHLSQHTIHNHLQTIYALLGVHSRAELLALFLRRPDLNSFGEES